MDELEISGKRFISTRFAAKLHKYHSDYIGQLVRAKKVVGQKVGRAWYVDAESLAAYFKDPHTKEDVKKTILSVQPVERADTEPEAAQPAPAEKAEVAAAQPIAEAVRTKGDMQSFRRPIQVETAEEKSKQTFAAAEEAASTSFVEMIDVEPDAPRDSIHIPIHRANTKKNSGLRYVEEEESSNMPVIEEKMHTSSATLVADDDEMRNGGAFVVSGASMRGRAGMLVPTLSIVTLGALAFAVVALGSLFVNYTAVVEAGQTASVGYSLR